MTFLYTQHLIKDIPFNSSCCYMSALAVREKNKMASLSTLMLPRPDVATDRLLVALEIDRLDVTDPWQPKLVHLDGQLE